MLDANKMVAPTERHHVLVPSNVSRNWKDLQECISYACKLTIFVILTVYSLLRIQVRNILTDVHYVAAYYRSVPAKRP